MTRLVFIVLLAVFALSSAVNAQDPVVVVPPDGVFVYDATAGSPSLTPQALASGPILEPVIVQLDMPYTPEGQLPGDAAIQQQRRMIAQEQVDLINQMQTTGMAAHNPRSFTTIPYLAVMMDPNDRGRMANLDGVQTVEPDRLVKPFTERANPIVGAVTAQATGFDGSGYSVAVLDTGVDFTHPALVNQRVAEACFNSSSGGAFVSDGKGAFSQVIPACPNGQTIQIGSGAATPYQPGEGPGFCEFCGHGSHVAGIAAGNAEAGFRGVAPGAGLVGVNVFSIFTNNTFCLLNAGEPAPCTLGYTSDTLLGFEYVLEQSAAIDIAAVNLSLGLAGITFASPAQCDAFDNVGYRSLIDALRGQNIAVIAAAGNDGVANGLSLPACFSNTISVGATSVADSAPGINVTDGVASFSNSASFLDFWAPGLVIVSSEPVNRYVLRAGTSMSAPYIAGAWATMRQAYPNDSISQTQVRLVNSGVPVQDPRNGVVKPRLQLDTALPALNAQVNPCDVDTNGDGQITIVDVQTVAGRFGTTSEDPNYDTTLDFDASGQINVLDVQRVAGQFGSACSS